MPSLSADEQQKVAELIALRTPGYSLPGEFYSSDAVYRAELDAHLAARLVVRRPHVRDSRPGRLFHVRRRRRFADRHSRRRRPDPRAVERVPASRHADLRRAAGPRRPARVPLPSMDVRPRRLARLVPRHAGGRRQERARLAARASCARSAGLIYVSLCDNPPDFDEAAETIGPLARPQGFDRAKVAKIVDYDVAANWKLVWENNRECYHCNVNHPQYIKANFDHLQRRRHERASSIADRRGGRPQRGEVGGRRAGGQPSPAPA